MSIVRLCLFSSDDVNYSLGNIKGKKFGRIRLSGLTRTMWSVRPARPMKGKKALRLPVRSQEVKERVVRRSAAGEAVDGSRIVEVKWAWRTEVAG